MATMQAAGDWKDFMGRLKRDANMSGMISKADANFTTSSDLRVLDFSSSRKRVTVLHLEDPHLYVPPSMR